MIYFHSSSVVFAGIINKCSDTEKQNYETGAGALVESNNFSDPSEKVRARGCRLLDGQCCRIHGPRKRCPLGTKHLNSHTSEDHQNHPAVDTDISDQHWEFRPFYTVCGLLFHIFVLI